MFTVIEDQLETPVAWQCNRRFGIQIREIGCAVPIKEMFEIAVGGTGRVRSIVLVGLGEINSIRIFQFVLINNHVALVVIALADQPGEDAGGISWVGDPALRGLAV